MQELTAKWVGYFRGNRDNRAEPAWDTTVALPQRAYVKVLRSLEQFHLGDGGGPASLIAWDREGFVGQSEEVRELVGLWFKEEKEHSRLLGRLVARMGGTPITGHWSFTCFCLVRRLAGVKAELNILLLTEIVSTAYYRLLKRHCPDGCIRDVCRLILRDEAGHVRFHRERLAAAGGVYGLVWETLFRFFGLAAGTMLWVNHRPALKALGAGDVEFYVEAWLEMGRFVRRLRRERRVGASESGVEGDGVERDQRGGFLNTKSRRHKVKGRKWKRGILTGIKID